MLAFCLTKLSTGTVKIVILISKFKGIKMCADSGNQWWIDIMGGLEEKQGVEGNDLSENSKNSQVDLACGLEWHLEPA